jgi:flagella basal body P-ring formation protein FlgA
MAALAALLFGCMITQLSFGQGSNTSQGRVAELPSIELHLKELAQVSSNLVRLSDLIDVDHSAGINSRQLNLILAPSPQPKTEQKWTRASIESLLSLKGVAANAIQWRGSLECVVHSSNKVNADTLASASSTAGSAVELASASSPVEQFFEPTKAESKTVSSAERNVVNILQTYLRSKSDCDFDYEISVDIPAEGIPYLKNRNEIIGVSGGTSPWIGNQRFALQTKNRDGVTVVEIGAQVDMPPRVFATVRNLPRDHILSISDLKLVVLPKTSRIEASLCFIKPEDLLGKQLNRTLATGQPIEIGHVNSPRLVNQNDEIEVQVSAPGLCVTQTARALQGGGKDDLILVEVLPQRSKLTARVIATGVVSVISN